jgi:hypothetical protein
LLLSSSESLGSSLISFREEMDPTPGVLRMAVALEVRTGAAADLTAGLVAGTAAAFEAIAFKPVLDGVLFTPSDTDARGFGVTEGDLVLDGASGDAADGRDVAGDAAEERGAGLVAVDAPSDGRPAVEPGGFAGGAMDVLLDAVEVGVGAAEVGFGVPEVGVLTAAGGGPLTDFLSEEAAGGLFTDVADPVALDAAGGDGFTAPEPNVPELSIWKAQSGYSGAS